MYAWYLRNTYLENKLREPGALTVCGESVDLTLIDVPTFIYGSREDHIVPWQTAYASTSILSALKFVLGASGHIAGVINPPAKKKRSYWVNDSDLPESADDWFAGATEHPEAGGRPGSNGSTSTAAARWSRPPSPVPRSSR